MSSQRGSQVILVWEYFVYIFGQIYNQLSGSSFFLLSPPFLSCSSRLHKTTRPLFPSASPVEEIFRTSHKKKQFYIERGERYGLEDQSLNFSDPEVSIFSCPTNCQSQISEVLHGFYPPFRLEVSSVSISSSLIEQIP